MGKRMPRLAGLLVVLSAVAVSTVASFDLGPILRLGQCRSQCLKSHSLDGYCEWWRRGETGCNECWQHCELLEKKFNSAGDWESVQQAVTDSYSDCNDSKYKQCPSCKTACDYWKFQVVEEYLPSMLPAPRRAPISLDKTDVAIIMHKTNKQWRLFGYYPGERAPSTLRSNEWLLAVSTDNVVSHYSWEEWYPSLDALKPGPLYEATISWRDIATQLKRQQALEQKRFNDRVRQYFLERYGEKVLERRNQDEEQEIPEEVFRRFFFRRSEPEPIGHGTIDEFSEPATMNSEDEDRHGQVAEESFVVSWEPETGGLMGNQVADSNLAQISLLPGVKYWVRIASNEGPGSFPIEVDTSSGVIKMHRIKKKLDNVYPWAFLAAALSAAIVICIIVIVKLCKRSSTKTVQPEEEV
ncbi:uncharacterized protein LOC106640485 [Copidosoma floridanum]|uniref:uncharacterized protein LOC106640485 n=1 Tax=Copidosoma floridanum TaxID=29053 RepID=UPI0006C972D4|nr:uncharacterized protein LOC106640485 [Copidosoma floridanum]